MLHKKIILGFSCLILLSTTPQYAQQTRPHCGTDEVLKRTFDANRQARQEYLTEDNRLKQLDIQAAQNGYKSQNKALLPVYIIPIVFHVLHQYGTENISDAQILDAVRILNKDYRKLNSDTTNIVPAFQTIAADCQIEFRLAQKDPNGNCTNGIDRIYSSLTNNATDNSKLNPWPRANYLNIWVIKTFDPTTLNGVAAYATPPSNFGASRDGVIILSNFVGSIGTSSVYNSRDLTHEIGHVFNLSHTWGNTNNPGVSCGDDNVTDTPVTMGHLFTCPLADAVCTPGVIENVQNYMEYSYCSNMFTLGQKTRMRNALTSNTGQRNSLWTTSNLIATGVSMPSVLCKADFISNSITSNVMCAGDSITFTDISWNGNPTNWSWTFPGGTPATSTDSMPTIHYYTAGVYNASLTVTNSSGSVNTTKTNYIIVNSPTAMYANPIYSEGFETAAIPNTDWRINNSLPGGNTWVQTSSAAASGSKSVMITNLSTANGNVDELISPSIDLTAIAGGSLGLTYKVAYAQRATSTADKLQVYISTTCGKSWSLRQTLIGGALSTGGVQTASFVPNASQWASKAVPLSGLSTQNDLFIMFRFTSNGGNNIYIDDVNITGTTNIEEEIAATIAFAVYPNPSEGNSIVSFNLTDRQKVEMNIFDTVGRVVCTLFNGELVAGEHKFSTEKNNSLSVGIYFIQLKVGSHQFTKKLIVK